MEPRHAEAYLEVPELRPAPHLSSQHPRLSGYSMAPANLTSALEFLLLGLVDGTDIHPAALPALPWCLPAQCAGQPDDGGGGEVGWGPQLPYVLFLRSPKPRGRLLYHCRCPQTAGRPAAPWPGRVLPGMLCPDVLLRGSGHHRELPAGSRLSPPAYGAVLTPGRCAALMAASWAGAHLHYLRHTLLISALSYPCPAPVRHFCDMTVMLSLATLDTAAAEAAIFSEGLAVVLTPLVLVSLSYARILFAVLGVLSAGGRRRAFSTCGAHLVVVSLFFGSVLSVSFRPSSAYSAGYDRLASVVYAVLTPTLNPFIYSLRNKEVQGALKKELRWRAASQEL